MLTEVRNSIWRPLNDVVMNTPLLLCDRQSVQRKDLIEVDKVLPDKVEKSYFLHYRDYHRWHSLRNQRLDEVAMFITWRSDLAGQKFAGKICVQNECLQLTLASIFSAWSGWISRRQLGGS